MMNKISSFRSEVDDNVITERWNTGKGWTC